MTFVVTRQRAQEVHDMARARAGLPYAYGGAFTLNPKQSTDCSGLVLQTAAWYGGRKDWPGNRYGSTESFRLNHKIVSDLGFKRLPPGGLAALPFTPVMLVGLQHGGGGVYSHTACTLMTMDYPGGPVTVSKRGVDWESQGDGVFLYDGARAWNDPLFHDFWYLDAKLEDGVKPSGPDDRADILARATGLSRQRAAEILPAVADGLRASECYNQKRIAAWLAQIGHESGSFQYTEEIDKNGRYAPYIGRTWIQITWESNYRAFSKWCYGRGLVPTPDYFVTNYRELADLKWAGLGAAWYWTVARPDINTLCDAGDFDTVTYRINGGQNGADDRRSRYQRALQLGGNDLLLLLDTHQPEPEPTIEELLMSDRLYESWSIYKKPGEGAKLTLSDFIRAIDAREHERLIRESALAGDLDAINDVFRVASGQGEYKDAKAINRAKSVIAELKATKPDVLDAYLESKGIA